jgi:glucoamylase
LVKYHGGQDGHLSEEFDRNSGYMVGAGDLTWSYASLMTAGIARGQASGDAGYLTNLANAGF